MDITTQGQITTPQTENTTGGPTNIYPVIRTFFLFVITIIIIVVALYLVYQNGKSIYEHGV